MRKLTHENYALIFGLSLPFLMIIFFGLATFIPKYFVKPPQYNLIFTNNYNSILKLDVNGGKLKATLLCKKDCEKFQSYSKPKLYVFNTQSQTLREITINLPELHTISSDTEIPIPEVEHYTIDSSITSPDGYTFSRSSSSNGIFSLFFDRSSGYLISKDGYTIEIKSPISYGLNFIGWITHEGN